LVPAVEPEPPLADGALEHADLMAQGQVLQREFALGPEQASDQSCASLRHVT